MKRCKSKLAMVAATAALMFGIGRSYGAGFAILEQTAAGLGRALAGMSADIENGGGMYFNPSVSAWHKDAQISAGISLLHVNARLDLKPETNVAGNDGGNGGGWSYVPHFFYVQPITEDLAAGLSFSATSGTAVHWDENWAGRYHNVDTEIANIDLTPSLSYKICDELSFGAGFMIEFCSAKMTQMVNMGPYGDKLLKFEGDSMAYGYSFGAMFQPIEGTRIGVGYRSFMVQRLELEGELQMPAGGPARGNADCDLKLPGFVDLGIQQDLNKYWTVMATFCWNHSKYMQEMEVKFQKNSDLQKTLGVESSRVDMHWRNNWRASIGAEYRPDDQWIFRFGSAFDQTPVRGENYRVASIPDASRVWLSCGASYAFNKTVRLDFGYVHLMFIHDTMRMQGADGSVVRTSVGGNCDIISMALTFTL